MVRKVTIRSQNKFVIHMHSTYTTEECIIVLICTERSLLCVHHALLNICEHTI